MPPFVSRKRLLRLLIDRGCSVEMSPETNRVDLTRDSCTRPRRVCYRADS